MKKQLVLGIMSGTSIDGVDYALCEVGPDGLSLRHLWSAAFPQVLEKRLHAAAAGHLRSYEAAQLHHDLGRFYSLEAAAGLKGGQVDLVGLHGQTVFHNPDKAAPATLQLGEPAYLVEQLRAPVVNNFRAADLAAGGQGAPLATRFHVDVFGRAGRHVCVNNLGGISNVTSIDWHGQRRLPKVQAFDTGPANLLIDHAMRHFTKGKKRFDENGAWAGQGRVSEELLTKWLKHSYFFAAPPKSTGRELFGEEYLQQRLQEAEKRKLTKEDTIATLTAFTAGSLALNYRLHLDSVPDDVILTGGGASNPVLLEAIRAQLAQVNQRVKVESCEALGWPVQSIEPAAFALLAWLRFHRRPGNLPETTGAGRAVLCGQITEP